MPPSEIFTARWLHHISWEEIKGFISRELCREPLKTAVPEGLDLQKESATSLWGCEIFFTSQILEMRLQEPR